MGHKHTFVAVGVLMAALMNGARADDAAFATLDRPDEVSRAGGEVSYVDLDDVNELPRFGLRIEAHAQLVNPSTGFGAYETIAVELVNRNGYDGALNNVEIGALYATRVHPSLEVVVHAGGTLPSASPIDPNDSEANVLVGKSRPSDLVLTFSDAVTLRLAGSLLFRHDRLFARGDLGLDVTVTNSNSTKPMVRIDGGVGLDLGTSMFTAELTNLFGVRGTNITAVSARFRAGRLQPYAALVIPLLSVDRFHTSASLTVGLDGLLP